MYAYLCRLHSECLPLGIGSRVRRRCHRPICASIGIIAHDNIVHDLSRLFLLSNPLLSLALSLSLALLSPSPLQPVLVLVLRRRVNIGASADHGILPGLAASPDDGGRRGIPQLGRLLKALDVAVIRRWLLGVVAVAGRLGHGRSRGCNRQRRLFLEELPTPQQQLIQRRLPLMLVLLHRRLALLSQSVSLLLLLLLLRVRDVALRLRKRRG